MYGKNAPQLLRLPATFVFLTAFTKIPPVNKRIFLKVVAILSTDCCKNILVMPENFLDLRNIQVFGFRYLSQVFIILIKSLWSILEYHKKIAQNELIL
jgi:hypothetical protein